MWKPVAVSSELMAYMYVSGVGYPRSELSANSAAEEPSYYWRHSNMSLLESVQDASRRH